MEKTVAEMTTSELREMMEDLIEEKIVGLFGDPDQGLELRESLRERLLRQRREVAAGERGETLDEVERRLGLA
ncbi:MAG TPA: hypothetical protein VIC28_10525 [Thermoanaerobaculia bacterium]